MTYEFNFNVELQPDGEGGFIYQAELVGADPEVPYGYGYTPFEAILDLCESMTEGAAE